MRASEGIATRYTWRFCVQSVLENALDHARGSRDRALHDRSPILCCRPGLDAAVLYGELRIRNRCRDDLRKYVKVGHSQALAYKKRGTVHQNVTMRLRSRLGGGSVVSKGSMGPGGLARGAGTSFVQGFFGLPGGRGMGCEVAGEGERTG